MTGILMVVWIIGGLALAAMTNTRRLRRMGVAEALLFILACGPALWVAMIVEAMRGRDD